MVSSVPRHMQTHIIQDYLSDYRQWKSRVARSVRELEGWLGIQGELNEENRAHIRRTLSALQEHRLRIAVLGEPGRGKSVLIDALFFADYQEPLLTASQESGKHSARCPLEILWDERRNESYLRLLPIESRTQNLSIAALKKDPKYWVHYPLQTQDLAQLVSTLSEIRKQKSISLGEAKRLGLLEEANREGSNLGKVSVMKWRYAIMSFPHPLFKQGLSLISVPDLQGLASEPELLADLLPKSQALLFLLAADTAVSANDREIWRYLSHRLERSWDKTLIVLNKSDLLWDQPQNPKAEEPEVQRQITYIANTLVVQEDRIAAVSARMGFQAKVNEDDLLLAKSQLSELEHRISRQILEERYQQLSNVLDVEIGQLVNRSRQRITQRIQNIESQLAELEEMRKKSADVLEHLLHRIQADKDLYLKSISLFQASREKLLAETEIMRQSLNKELIDQLLEENQQELEHAWSTSALLGHMKQLFDELGRAVQKLIHESERVRRLLLRTYRRFDRELGFNLSPPEVFSTAAFVAEAEQIQRAARLFYKRPRVFLLPKAVVIDHYRDLVERFNALFDSFRADFERSMRLSLQPIIDQIEENKRNIALRVENLERINRSKDNLQERIDEANKQYVETAKQLTALRNINNALRYNPLKERKSPKTASSAARTQTLSASS